MEEERNCFSKFLKIAVLSWPMKLESDVLKVNENDTKYVRLAPVISMLSQKFASSYEFVEPPAGMWESKLPDGNWSGIIGMVLRGDADVGMCEIAITADRFPLVNYSYPLNVLEFGFVTDKPKYVSDMYGISHTFSNAVWAGIAISLLLVQFISHFLRFTSYSFQRMLSNIFAILLENSANIRYRKLSTNLLMLSWILGSCFITMCYKAVFFSCLMLPASTGIRTIEELAEATQRSSFKCSSFPGSGPYMKKLEYGVEAWRKIAKCVRRTDMLTLKIAEFLRPTTYEKAYIGVKEDLKRFKDAYYISDEIFWVQPFGIPVGRSFPCRETLSRSLNRIHAAGRVSRYDDDKVFFTKLHREKDVRIEEDSPTRPLKLVDLMLAFEILLFGCLMSTLVFAGEVLKGRKYIHKKECEDRR